MFTALQGLKDMIDVNTIVGDAITAPDGTVIIPISKVSFGFASGGSDIPAKVEKEVFGGGAGAGVTIKPQAFIVVSPTGDTKILEMGAKGSPVDSLIESAPELLNKAKEIFGKKKDDKASEE